MLVAELLARYLADAGAGAQFGVVGEGNIAVVTALAELGVPYVAARREDGAVAMADGWARRSGRMGLASVTSGPGLTNAVTSLLEAVRHGTPMVVVTSLVPASAPHHPQQLRARELVAATGAGWRRLSHPAALARDVATVAREAHLQRRPQVLAVPQELLYVDVDDLLLDDTLPSQLPVPLVWRRPPIAPAVVAVEQATAAVRASRRPVVVAGRGVVDADAGSAVAELARRLGAPLATTLLGRGLFPDDPAHIGIFGGLATPHGSDVLPAADLVLAVGCSLNPWTTMQGQLLEGATLVQCDTDPAALGRWQPADVGIVGDARATTDALLASLAEDGVRPSWAPRPLAREPDGPAGDGRLRTADVAEALAARLPAGVTLAFDSGHAVLDAVPHLPVDRPERFVFPVHAGAVGQGLGTAIGAALAAGDEEWTVLVVGDGALSMSLQELDTARQHRLPLLILVLDDGAYGAEVHYAAAYGLPDTHAWIDNPDYVAVARALGFVAHRVDAIDDLDVVADVLSGPPRPTLVHVPVAAAPMSRWYQAFTASIVPVRWTGGR